MSYTSHTWQTGETVTAEKLNNLEEGAVFTINASIDISGNILTLNVTAAEIIAAVTSGKLCYIFFYNEAGKEVISGTVNGLTYGGNGASEGPCWIWIGTSNDILTFTQPGGGEEEFADFNFYPVTAS